ncbi:MAG: hypothetical protein FWH14_01200 [Oscillospiraceae bacterium]|nr:hypothetical protein [Oscillospiraceae bacterium]
MNKLTALILTAILSLSMLSACGKAGMGTHASEDGSRDTSGSGSVSVSEGWSEDDDPYRIGEVNRPTFDPDFEHTALNTADFFLTNIKEKNYKKVAAFAEATDAEAYRFIERMDLDSYEIVESLFDDDVFQRTGTFKVKLNISKSSSEYFPVGESYWDLVIDNLFPVSLFRPSDEENFNFNFYEDRDYNFCYRFSTQFGIFKTANDFNEILAEQKTTDGFYGLVHRILHFYDLTTPERKEPISVNELKEYMHKTAGITAEIDYKNSEYFNFDSANFHIENEDHIACGGHGGDWIISRPVSKEYDDKNKQYTVVIDYYADAAQLVVARTMKYTFEMNDDNTRRMISTEVLYKSGFGVKHGTT